MRQIAAADGYLAAHIRVIVAAGKRGLVHLVPQAAQGRHENIFKRRVVDAQVFNGDARGAQALIENAPGLARILRQKIQAGLQIAARP